MNTYDLELIGVGKTYDDGAPAVTDFNLAVEKGEFIAFLGPSGCGKTTTLRMIAGFESITTGDIFIAGRRINDMPPERRPTSTIFQNYALFPHMSVRRNVAYGLDVKGVPRAERDRKVDRMLATLGLDDVADAKPTRLSGGQRQRIALARGLVVEPEILLLDEPLGALDANLRRTIQAELKLLQVNLGITFIFVTHAQSEALTMSDRVVVMSGGRVEQISTPRDLYTRPGSPFVAEFIGRNTILPGTLDAVSDGVGRVTTGMGSFTGMAGSAALRPGGAAAVVVPAEAFVMVPSQGAPAGAPAGDNALEARIESRSVVGPIVRFDLAVADGRSVVLEGHRDRYGEGFAAGAPVRVTWDPAKATIIPAAAA